MANTNSNYTTIGAQNSNPNIEVVDSNQDLTIQCATIQNLFELSSPSRTRDQNVTNAIDGQTNRLSEDDLRRVRGTIIDNKTGKVVHHGGFFPYEFGENEENKFEAKMVELNHKLEDMKVEYSYEGTIIRIFYHKQWYVSTHRKLDSGRSKWGSDKSFKFLFEKGLQEGYNMTLKELFNGLNLRCQYTFMVMADENTRFVAKTNHLKQVYFVGSDDPEDHSLKIDRLPKPQISLKTQSEIFNFVKGQTYPFMYQGLLLTHKNGSQYRITSDEYALLFKVRNNEQSVPYRYLQLRSQNNHQMIALLKKLFPQYISTFESHEKSITNLVDIIYHEFNKRKQRTLLPDDLTTVPQIDQKLYLFIKNRLLKIKGEVTPEKILELLWLEEPSNLNHMIRMAKYNQRKVEIEQKLIVEIEKVNLLHTPSNPIPIPKSNAPRRKKVTYTRIPVDFTCRRKLF